MINMKSLPLPFYESHWINNEFMEFRACNMYGKSVSKQKFDHTAHFEHGMLGQLKERRSATGKMNCGL